MRVIAEIIGGAGIAIGLGIGMYRLMAIFERGLKNKSRKDQKGSK